MPILKKTMFREYDMRGRESDDELNDESMYYIGRGFGTYLRKRNINEAVVGHDARATSESFHQAVIKGLTECGVNVINTGIVTTPMSYWSQHFLKVKGLVTVTASHNPAGWNGVKLGSDLSYTLLADELQEVYDIIAKEKFVDGKGTIRKEDIAEDYKSAVNKLNDHINKKLPQLQIPFDNLKGEFKKLNDEVSRSPTPSQSTGAVIPSHDRMGA